MFFPWLRLLYSNHHGGNQKQPARGVPKKKCSENIKQVYKRAAIPKCNFNKVTLQLYLNHSSALRTPTPLLASASLEENIHSWKYAVLLHVFRSPFSKNTSGWLLLKKFTVGNATVRNQRNVWQ